MLLGELFEAADEADAAGWGPRIRALPPREQRRLHHALQTVTRELIATGGDTRRYRPDDPSAADPYVAAIAPHRRAQAARDFADGNVTAFLAAELDDPKTDDALTWVVRNAGALHTRGLYEQALIGAFRTGWRLDGWPGATIRWLFSLCDADRFRAQGDPLPGPGPFDVYRGGGRGTGLSWSRDPLVAALFADQSGTPTIRRATLAAADVRACTSPASRTTIWKYRSGGRAPDQLAWLSRRSDEFIAAADPGGVELEDAEALALIARVR